MVSWSTRRQFFYISATIAVFLFALALPIFFVTYKAPSCTDGKQNQGEFGVDCGGPCSILCKANALDLVTHWQRSFKVKEGVYSAVAYVENPNFDSGIRNISYRFKLYDKDNLLIYQRDGNTFIPPRKIIGIFESNILTGTRVPVRTFFEFSGIPVWVKTAISEPPLAVISRPPVDQETSPRLTASLENRGLDPIYNVEVVAIVYDGSSNAIAASRTIVDSLGKNALAPLTFTWPEPFAVPAVRAELLYRALR